MAQFSETRTFDTLLTTTQAAYAKTVVDQINHANGLFYVLNKPNVKRLQDGGERAEVPLRIVKSTSGGWYEGYDPLNTDPADPLTKAYFDWKQLYYSVTLSRKEQRQNAGQGRIINFLQKLNDDAVDAMTQDLNTAMFGTNASATKQIFGLQNLVPENPATGIVGGINRATSSNSWWKNKVCGNGGTNYTWHALTSSLPTAWVEMEKLFENCSKGGGPKNRKSPNIGMANQYFYRSYITGVEPQRRFSNVELARVGFKNIMFNDMPIMWDEDCASANSSASVGCCYFLNSNFIHLYVDSETDFYTTPFVRPANQDVRTMQFLWMGCLTISSARKHGIIVDYNSTDVT